MASTPDTGQHAGQRPLSPHVSIWRWHATMAASIAHRVSGVALYGASVIIAALIVAAASGPDAYQTALGLALSIPGRLVLFGATLAAGYHLANGIRHLIWDGPGFGFSPKTASLVSIFNFGFAIGFSLALWYVAYYGLSLGGA